jgi:hypothetical protein
MRLLQGKLCKIKSSLSVLIRILIDEAWSKEETDYLFELVREFDSRFYIVADRYNYPAGPERSLEVIKILLSFCPRINKFPGLERSVL